MANENIFTVAFRDIAISAAQDLIEIAPADDFLIEIIWGCFTQHSDTDSEMLSIAMHRLTATVTSGTGGAAVTPRKKWSSQPAASFTAERNNTTRATTSGTDELLIAEGINVLSGFGHLLIPQIDWGFKQGEAFILGLEEAPVDAVDGDLFLYVREIG